MYFDTASDGQAADAFENGQECGRADALREMIEAQRDRVSVLAEAYELSLGRGPRDYYTGHATGQYREAAAMLEWLERVAQNAD